MYEAVISNNKVLVLFWPSRDAAGYNVYRDGRFLKSIDGDETYFRDVPPRGNHTYTMIAYGYKGNYFVKAKGSSSINY